MHHAVKFSVAGSCNAALLVALLSCITGQSVDAFAIIRSIAAISESTAGKCRRCAALSATWSSASTTARPARSRWIAPSFTPVPLSCGRRRCKAGYGGCHATRCCVDDDPLKWAASFESAAPDQRRSNNYGCPPAAVQHSAASRRDVSDAGEASGFEWLREFGNGKMDVAGLVMSTVFLMTAVAPMGIAADLGVVDGGRLDQHPPRQRLVGHLTVEHPGRVGPLLGEAKATPAGLATSRTERVGALRLGDMASRHAPPPSSGVNSRGTTDSETIPRRTGPLAQMAGNAASSARGVAERAMAIRSRAAEQDRMSDSSRSTDAANLVVREEKPRAKTRISPLFSNGGVNTGLALSPGRRAATKTAVQPDPAELLNRLEVGHVELYGESLPLPTTPESFNRAIRKALPALVPPAMAIFLTVSMPAVVLLLKGIGTTVVAVAKGYGKGDRRRAEDEFEAGAPLQVGFGGDGSGRDRLRGRSAENPGPAFQMFLGGNGGDGGVNRDRPSELDIAERKSSLPADRSSMEETRSYSSLPPQQVETDRQGFFSIKHNRSNGGGSGGGGKNPSGGGFAVGDDAMTAMAMVAMTQELNTMKQSLQTEVETMKQELERASDDSRRLADKLIRLEEDNRHLKAMVSRLGGQDARRLKAQLFSLLASPSMAQLKDGSPQTQPTPA